MLKGKLTGLRAVETEDLPFFKEWRNLPEFRRNFREVRELNMNNQVNWFNKVNASPNDFMFTIVDLKNGEPIGAAGLLYTNWIIRSADFSFYIGYNNLYIDNGGLAKDAARLLIEYGFQNLNLNKIWMEIYEFDAKKIYFFMNVFGFHKDGTLRQNCFEEGRYWDSIIISLLKNEFTTF